jgi:predicted metal-binding protein
LDNIRDKKITLDKTSKEEGRWKPKCRFPTPSYGKKRPKVHHVKEEIEAGKILKS